MERFEAWLTEQGIGIAGQYATGSGDMLRYRLRLTDGYEFEDAIKGETLVEPPDEAIEQLREAMGMRRGSNGHTNRAQQHASSHPDLPARQALHLPRRRRPAPPPP